MKARDGTLAAEKELDSGAINGSVVLHKKDLAVL